MSAIGLMKGMPDLRTYSGINSKGAFSGGGTGTYTDIINITGKGALIGAIIGDGVSPGMKVYIDGVLKYWQLCPYGGTDATIAVINRCFLMGSSDSTMIPGQLGTRGLDRPLNFQGAGTLTEGQVGSRILDNLLKFNTSLRIQGMGYTGYNPKFEIFGFYK